MLRTLKLTISYDGTAYAGWQWQANGPSVQAALEATLAKVVKQASRITASGRTDRGVHALAQVVSFSTTSRITPEALKRALNAELPEDIAVHAVEEAPVDFHPICDAIRKRYRYVIHDGREPVVFARHYCWHVRQRLDAERMDRAAQAWLGRHDFASFQSSNSRRLSTVRTVYELSMARDPQDRDFIRFEVEADGFLYNMVRTMVGTLVVVGRGKHPESWTAEVLAARDRRQAGMRAPAQGLFLLRVDYLPGNAPCLNRPEVADFKLQPAD